MPLKRLQLDFKKVNVGKIHPIESQLENSFGLSGLIFEFKKTSEQRSFLADYTVTISSNPQYGAEIDAAKFSAAVVLVNAALA